MGNVKLHGKITSSCGSSVKTPLITLPKYFENLFTSFTIEQIGKEFDLIKIDMDTLVLNIELKSEDVGVEAI